jgi:hypothetical protein
LFAYKQSRAEYEHGKGRINIYLQNNTTKFQLLKQECKKPQPQRSHIPSSTITRRTYRAQTNRNQGKETFTIDTNFPNIQNDF